MRAITPMMVRAVAGQFGFRHLRLVEGNVVHSLLQHGNRTLTQVVGRVTDAQRLLDFCRAEHIAIDDDRTPYVPEWRDDPWVDYGA